MSDSRTLLACLERAAACGEGVRFLGRSEERWLSYRDILERARVVAGGLRELGVERGARVAVAAPTAPSFYDAFFGVLAAGASPLSLPLPPRFGGGHSFREELRASLEAAGVRLVLTDVPDRVRIGDVPVVSLPELPDATPLLVESDPDSIALVQLSSGTTGTPKAVPLTHRQLLSNVRAIRDRIRESYPAESHAHGTVSWLPLYHDMGLVGAVLTSLAEPAPLALMKPEEFVARPARWLQAISRTRATISAAPHFAYDLALDKVRDEELEGVDLSSWLLALDGAEPVIASGLSRFYERFRAHGLRREALTPVYGLAEASLAVTFSDPRTPFTVRSFASEPLAKGQAIESAEGVELVSSGRPLSGVRVEIADESGARLSSGRIGRVLVRGPSVTSEGLDPDEFLDTGDLGFFCADELYLCGRSRDLLILRGRNYSPEMIERALVGIPGIRSVAAVSCQRGLCVLAERSPKLDEPRAIEEIRTRVLDRCGVDPRVIFLRTGSLPRTSSGKIRRQEAARLFSQQ
jgi:acyl-CoA synthetase (AMP-forming)/AMP-acid ligase II